ncbi:imelysin family protein [Pseudoruegeria sp. HB172150]|uniref:imelysin family protein n=1 Tax=Pseudoruegeria sp. HB172150 TaxID=2721164 RepID=UPI0015518D43|nr:imelysin family protein [Pseudoruegeria sp. HB172150]
MRLIAACFALVFTAVPTFAYDIDRIIDEHVLPGFGRLAANAEVLDQRAQEDCSATSPGLREAYNDAFDSWVRISHLRFGPTETGDRAFALAFWPDTKGFTPRELTTLIEARDPAADSEEDFSHVSIAGRGFYALEFLLYDPQFMDAEPEEYRCKLLQAVARDISATAQAILDDWQNGYADLLRNAGENDIYRSEEEAVRAFFGSVVSGLQFTSDTRLGRPLGSFERPRPNRAEARRSNRSARNVLLSLEGTRDLVRLLADGAPNVEAELDTAYDRALDRLAGLEDPTFAGVGDVQGRFEVEILQQNIDRIRELLGASLAPILGVGAGFNALDGD